VSICVHLCPINIFGFQAYQLLNPACPVELFEENSEANLTGESLVFKLRSLGDLNLKIL
jgi:hypothetical protein